jgi:hypothetical protein
VLRPSHGPFALDDRRVEPTPSRGAGDARSRDGFEPTEIAEADDGDLFLTVLDDAMAAMRAADIPFLLIGDRVGGVWARPLHARHRPVRAAGVGTSSRPGPGRPRLDTRTVDVHWLSKAFKDGVLVDAIFRRRETST